jgi:hypothetical protein
MTEKLFRQLLIVAMTAGKAVGNPLPILRNHPSLYSTRKIENRLEYGK